MNNLIEKIIRGSYNNSFNCAWIEYGCHHASYARYINYTCVVSLYMAFGRITHPHAKIINYNNIEIESHGTISHVFPIFTFFFSL